MSNAKGIRKSLCHPDRLESARGMCHSCYVRVLKGENPEFAEAHRKREREYRRNRYKDRPEERLRWMKDHGLRQKHGITISDYDKMMSDQDGKCAICGEGEKKLCVDHCHTTGLIRSLLCHKCNAAVGYREIGDSFTEKVDAYLSEWRSRR